MTSPHPYRSKLDFAQAESMRERSMQGESVRALADAYGVCMSSVYDVLSGRTHAPTVTVRLKAREFIQLLRLADDAGESCQEFAESLLRRGLGRAVTRGR